MAVRVQVPLRVLCKALASVSLQEFFLYLLPKEVRILVRGKFVLGGLKSG